jgi:hypothetical protein
MTQMATAVGTDDLRPRHSDAAVLDTLHGAGDAVEVGRPAAAGLELGVGLI